MRLFAFDLVVVTDASIAKTVLNSPDKFMRDDRFGRGVVGLMDYALFTLPSGEMWKKHRKLLQPAFGPSHLRHTAIVAKQVSQELGDDFKRLMIEESSESAIVDIKNCFSMVTVDVIGRIAFSFDFNAVKLMHTEESSQAKETLDQAFVIVQKRFGMNRLMWRFAGIAPSSPMPLKVGNYLKSLVNEIIEKRKEKGEDVKKERWDMDVLDRLLAGNDKPGQEKFTQEEIVGELIGFFLAGSETTSNTMTFMVYELCKNPDIMKKLVAEIDKVYEELNGDITPENLHHFKYLDCVMRETQRYHSVVQTVGRVPTQAVEINGHVFPAYSTRFMLNIANIHRNKSYWDNPNVFDPERMLKPIIPGAFLPFGDGGMMCIGYKMAQIEAKCVLIHLFRDFKFELIKHQSFHRSTSITHTFTDGLFVKVSQR